MNNFKYKEHENNGTQSGFVDKDKLLGLIGGQVVFTKKRTQRMIKEGHFFPRKLAKGTPSGVPVIVHAGEFILDPDMARRYSENGIKLPKRRIN